VGVATTAGTAGRAGDVVRGAKAPAIVMANAPAPITPTHRMPSLFRRRFVAFFVVIVTSHGLPIPS